jgi:hypothetical protein
MAHSLVQAALFGLGGLAVAVAAAVLIAVTPKPDDKPVELAGRPPIPIAVLGDSDSKSYHDSFTFKNPAERGGPYRPTTYNWIEVLARLRGNQLDPGEWALWGMRTPIVRIREVFGMPTRLPRAEEYRYNFAFEGATCSQLLEGPRRQVPRLLELIDREGDRWNRGIIVVRIGINSFGGSGDIARLARNSADPQVMAGIDACLDNIRTALVTIRAKHPKTHIVLVGVFNNADWAENLARWQSADETANIARGLDRFDDGLRRIAEDDPAAAFFDDRAWFRERWGSRDGDGKPAYGDVVIGRGFKVSNSTGDHPSHASVVDGHAGAVWHALWAQSLVGVLNERFDLGIPPIEDEELVGLLDPAGTFGMK